MFKAVGSFFGKMFGTDKAAESIINHVSSGLDKLHYGDQEKAQDEYADRSEARKMLIQWLANTQGQNLARRFLALSIGFVWLSQFMVMQLINVVSIWTKPEISVKLIESGVTLKNGLEYMSDPVMLILAFYFGAPYMGDLTKAIFNKKSR